MSFVTLSYFSNIRLHATHHKRRRSYGGGLFATLNRALLQVIPKLQRSSDFYRHFLSVALLTLVMGCGGSSGTSSEKSESTGAAAVNDSASPQADGQSTPVGDNSQNTADADSSNTGDSNTTGDMQTGTPTDPEANAAETNTADNNTVNNPSGETAEGSDSTDVPSDTDQNPPVNEVSTVSIAINSANSPIPGMKGVQLSLANDSDLSLLIDENSSSDLTINRNPALTDGDMKNTIGNAFFEFTAGDVAAQVVLTTDEPIEQVYACHVQQQRCDVVPVELLSANAIALQPRYGWHYLFAKVPQ